ncbi:XRE family transcriptional regulator [Streptomyces sp. SM18]|nr:XRE family transcriptional regulator [Streptomyces sp. SM18]
MAQLEGTSREHQYIYALCSYALCRRRFRRRRGPGRPRAYCSTACRRLAQRLRDDHRASTGQWSNRADNGRVAAERLQYLSDQLLDGERRAAQLEDLVRAAGAVAAGVESYVGAAVNDARRRGQSWVSVARAVNLSPDAARRKWQGYTGPEAASLPEAVMVGTTPFSGAGYDVASARSNREQLGAALRYLLRASGRTTGAVADQAGIPATAFSRLLTGERIPEWPAVFTLTTILDGRPEELRMLWEWAKGRTPTAAHGGATAVARLGNAMRGLHLAAGRPTMRDLGLPGVHGAGKLRLLEAVVNGDSMAGWEDFALLVQHLGGSQEQFRHLWEDVQYSIFTLSVKAAVHGTD